MPHARNLVVYFSRTGITRRVALSLAAALEADIEEIAEDADRSGLSGYMRSLIDVITLRPVRVAPVKHDISSYELVVIGTPVWAASVSSPVRTWLLANRSHLRRVAFFCTLGGRGHDAALAQMGSLAQRRPLATCAIAAREIRRGEESRLIDIFTHRLAYKRARLDELEWMA